MTSVQALRMADFAARQVQTLEIQSRDIAFCLVRWDSQDGHQFHGCFTYPSSSLRLSVGCLAFCKSWKRINCNDRLRYLGVQCSRVVVIECQNDIASLSTTRIRFILYCAICIAGRLFDDVIRIASPERTLRRQTELR